jgi:hypothetical protein
VTREYSVDIPGGQQDGVGDFGILNANAENKLHHNTTKFSHVLDELL